MYGPDMAMTARVSLSSMTYGLTAWENSLFVICCAASPAESGVFPCSLYSLKYSILVLLRERVLLLHEVKQRPEAPAHRFFRCAPAGAYEALRIADGPL